MGSATAANMSNVKTLSNQSSIKKHQIVDLSHNNTTNSSVTKINSNNGRIVPGSGCCSVLVHVKKGYDVFSFRRDSVYTANLYIKKTSWYGKDALEEYKTTNGNFFHSIISKNGWIVGSGGPDIPYLNKQLMDLAGRTSVSGHITASTIRSATSILRQMGMGHFLIKAPDDIVGIVTYNGGNLKTELFKMSDGRYVSVPNSPSCYRTGFVSTTDPVDSTIKLAMTDRWGVNRRNIMTYQVQNVKDLINYSTSIKIYACDSRGTPDSIVFNGKLISKNTLPRAPNKKFIGQMVFKEPTNIPQGITGEVLNGLNYGYRSTFSADGKNITVNFNLKKSDLHYQIFSSYTTGIKGYGNYTIVKVTGTDKNGRKVYRTINYFNNLFLNSRLSLSTAKGNVFYTSVCNKTGSKIFETITGKISSELTFRGSVTTALDFKNGQQLYKNSTINISYLKNGTIFGNTLGKLKFEYQNIGGKYTIVKKSSNSTTTYTNYLYTRTTGMNFYYQHDSQGKLVGLKINGTTNGVQKIGISTAKYSGNINMQTTKDPTDIYSGSYVNAVYREKVYSSNSIINKTTPLYESLIL